MNIIAIEGMEINAQIGKVTPNRTKLFSFSMICLYFFLKKSFVKLDISTMKVFIAIFANSEYFSRMIVGKPQYLQSLMEPRTSLSTGTRALFVHDLGHFLDTASDITAKLDALRRFKHQSEIRIGVSASPPARATSVDPVVVRRVARNA